MVTKVLERFAEQSSVKCDFSPKFDNYIKKIKDQVFWYKIESRMKQICEDPYIGEKKRGKIKNLYGYKFYYVRTQYVLTYVIITAKKGSQKGIEFIKIDDRGDDYKAVERYFATSKHN